VTRNQEAILNIHAFKGAPEIVAGINNSTLEVTVATKGNKLVNFTVTSKDLKKNELVLKLKFEDASSISSGSGDGDILEV